MREPTETTTGDNAEQPNAWQLLERIIAAEESDAAQNFLKELPPGEDARVMARLSHSEQQNFLGLLDHENAARLMESLPEVQAGQLLSALTPEQAAHIVDEMHSDEQVDLLHQLSDVQTEAILQEMAPEEAENVRFLSQYNDLSAGGLMITELLSFEESLTVDDVVSDLRKNAEKYAAYDVQYSYVIDNEHRLMGVLGLRDLLLAPPQRMISEMMIRNPTSVPVSTSLQDLQHYFDSHPLYGLPVIDEDQKLIGVVRRDDVEKASEEQAGRTFLRFAGIMGGEELRSLSLKIRSARRLSWLSINIVLNIIAASIIAMYEETLSSVIALAVFLPIVSDMSGCSGNQSIAVSTRELVLGVIRPRDWFYVFRKEFALGLLNGLALGLLLGFVAYLWKGNPYLGLVIGSALAVNTLMAVCLGAVIPLVLKGFKLDPALASGPILTTLTDMCGFFLVLSFAQAMLPWLI
ncbi:magnesium transporter [uncultured Gimesia sp.]|uniref:magnesium transporter n=1 Tax=uncultured Gimesia sp. TaxID=1678688 RepID=UPI0026073CDF|nr:magnesium transporter [uncultured Gimesia sp.]